MNRNAVISIRTVHDGEAEPMAFITDGMYSYDEGVCTASYYESEVTGMEGTCTTLSFFPDSVIIDREGSVTSTMVFKEGESSRMNYETPFGSTSMSLDTKRIVRELGPGGGSAEIDYVLGVQHRLFTNAKLFIDVTQQGEFDHVR